MNKGSKAFGNYIDCRKLKESNICIILQFSDWIDNFHIHQFSTLQEQLLAWLFCPSSVWFGESRLSRKCFQRRPTQEPVKTTVKWLKVCYFLRRKDPAGSRGMSWWSPGRTRTRRNLSSENTVQNIQNTTEEKISTEVSQLGWRQFRKCQTTRN